MSYTTVETVEVFNRNLKIFVHEDTPINRTLAEGLIYITNNSSYLKFDDVITENRISAEKNLCAFYEASQKYFFPAIRELLSTFYEPESDKPFLTIAGGSIVSAVFGSFVDELPDLDIYFRTEEIVDTIFSNVTKHVYKILQYSGFLDMLPLTPPSKRGEVFTADRISVITFLEKSKNDIYGTKDLFEDNSVIRIYTNAQRRSDGKRFDIELYLALDKSLEYYNVIGLSVDDLYLSSNALTLSINDVSVVREIKSSKLPNGVTTSNKIKIQFSFVTTGSGKEIVSNFDLPYSRVYIMENPNKPCSISSYPIINKVIRNKTNPELSSIKTGILDFIEGKKDVFEEEETNAHQYISTAIRMMKYSKKGVYVSNKEMLAVLFAALKKVTNDKELKDIVFSALKYPHSAYLVSELFKDYLLEVKDEEIFF